MRRFTIVWTVLALAACGGGGGGGDGGGPGKPQAGAPLLLAAGNVRLESTANADWAKPARLKELGIGAVDAAYDLTTPSGEPFVFDLLSRRAGNSGEVVVAVAHAEDGGTVPTGGPETLADAGLVASASGAVRQDDWLEAHGDGFARITVRGEIDRDQVIVVRAEGDRDRATAVVRVRIGPESRINVAAQAGGDYPGVTEDRTLYSSDSWQFGLPTVAVSGDRTSIVCYEGDRADPTRWERYEMRLQYEHATETVTGGASEETSPDSGNWRDHEIAALFNVLALVHTGTDKVTVRLSFDRGATFAQTETFRTGSRYSARLAQLSMAKDYTLAVLYWRASGADRSDLVLVEGKPDAMDEFDSPTSYAFGRETVLRSERGEVTPLLMEAVWSDGGDLVIGYAFTRFQTLPDLTWESTTQNRCAVRLYGEAIQDVLVEEDVVVGKDPSVAVTGSGAGLRIFYAYEGRDGVRLRTSEDGGRSFSEPVVLGDESSHTPTVFARLGTEGTRVDVLYLTQGEGGQELHLAHWDDLDTGDPATYRLTTATMTPSAGQPGPVPGARPDMILPDYGFRVTEVSWFGYDAVLEEGEIVVVLDEMTYDAYVCFYGAPGAWRGGFEAGAPAPGALDDFVPAEPPPLAPGLTEPVPEPVPTDMHQLRLLRLE